MLDLLGVSIFLFCLSCLSCILFICLLGTVREIKIHKVQLNILLGMLILSYSCISFFIVGKKGWDLNVHYSVIDRMRLYGINAANSQGVYEFFDLPVIKMLFFLISKFPYNNFLQVIAVGVDYILLYHAISEAIGKKKIHFRMVALFIMVHFSMSSFAYTISGFRNIMAFAFVSLALIRDLYNGKRNFMTLLLYLLPLGIHPAVILILFMRIFFGLVRRRKVITNLLLIWILPLKIIIDRLPEWNGNLYVEMVIKKARDYLSQDPDRLFSNFKFEVFRIIVIVMIAFICHKKIKSMRECDDEMKIVQFVKITCFFTLGSLPVYVIFDRLCVFLGWISLVPIVGYEPSRDMWKMRKECLILLFFSLLLFLMNIRHLFVYSQISFPWR